MNTKPTLETCAGLYAAAKKIRDFAERWQAIFRVVESAKKHGYTELQLTKARRAASSTTPALK